MATEASCLLAVSAGKMQTGLLEASPFNTMQVSYGFFNFCLLAFICFLFVHVFGLYAISLMFERSRFLARCALNLAACKQKSDKFDEVQQYVDRDTALQTRFPSLHQFKICKKCKKCTKITKRM